MAFTSRGGPLVEVDSNGFHEATSMIHSPKAYYPLFCLTEVPDQYFDALNAVAKVTDFKWIAITSSATEPDRLVADITAHLESSNSTPTPTPFVGSTVSEIAKFFDNTLVRPLDQRELGVFTDFTFLVVDKECLGGLPNSSVQEPAILVYSVAPDFEEAEKEDTTLKFLRKPLKEALVDAIGIERLTKTLKECSRPEPPPGKDLSLLTCAPLARLFPIEPITDPENQKYRIATRREAWIRKRDTITTAEDAGWDMWEIFDFPLVESKFP